jgi:hypothetical protein
MVLLSHMRFEILPLYAPQPPHHHVSLAPPVIMPVRVESSPIWSVGCVAQELRHGRFQLLEENQILWPLCFVLVNVDSFICLSFP